MIWLAVLPALLLGWAAGAACAVYGVRRRVRAGSLTLDGHTYLCFEIHPDSGSLLLPGRETK